MLYTYPVPEQSLPHLVSALVDASVSVQRILDAGYQEERARFLDLMNAAAPEVRPLLADLVPARGLARKFEIAFGVTVIIGKEVDFSVQAFPINLNYTRRHSIQFEQMSRLTVSVEQAPLTIKET